MNHVIKVIKKAVVTSNMFPRFVTTTEYNLYMELYVVHFRITRKPQIGHSDNKNLWHIEER